MHKSLKKFLCPMICWHEIKCISKGKVTSESECITDIFKYNILKYYQNWSNYLCTH